MASQASCGRRSVLGDWSRRKAWAGVLLLSILSACAVWRSLVGMPSPETHWLLVTGFTLAGCAAALAVYSSRWLEAAESLLVGGRSFLFLTAAFGLGLGLLIYWCGMRQFSGYDHGALVDTGWRLYQGQQPNIDFPCTTPVGFFLGAEYAFRLFGPSWSALILFTALFSVVLFFWSVWLAVRVFGERAFALLLAITVQSLSLLLHSFWWYNSTTSAAAAVFLLSASLFWHRLHEPSARWSYLTALVLLAMMKPNVAGVLLVSTTAVFLCSRERRWPALFLTTTALAVFMLVLWVNRLSLAALLQGYLSVASRGATLRQINLLFEALPPYESVLYVLTLVGVLVPAWSSITSDLPRFLARRPWIGMGGILAGLYAFLTNADCKLVDLAPVLIGALVMAAELETIAGKDSSSPYTLPAPRRFTVGLLLVLSFLGTGFAISRHQPTIGNLGYFVEYRLEPGTVQDGFFKGLHTGPALRETLAQLRETVDQYCHKRVVFGTYLAWAYAAFKLPSPLNEPVWWDCGVSYGLADEGKYAASFIQNRHDLVVLCKLPKSRVVAYPNEVLDELNSGAYATDETYSKLTLVKRLSDQEISANQHCAAAQRLSAEGNMEGALAELREGLRLAPELPEAINNLAWIRAAHPQKEFRNGPEAVRLAKRACQLTNYKRAIMVGTLGAAYAEAGQFEEAVTAAEKARQLALESGDNATATKNEQLIQLFKSRVPHREGM